MTRLTNLKPLLKAVANLLKALQPYAPKRYRVPLKRMGRIAEFAGAVLAAWITISPYVMQTEQKAAPQCAAVTGPLYASGSLRTSSGAISQITHRDFNFVVTQ